MPTTRSSLAFALGTALGAIAHAQCATTLRPSMQLPGTNGVVRAVHVWDPDGAGPQTPVVVVGGSFTLSGTVPVANLAAYDPATGRWADIGQGVGAFMAPSEVRALATAPNGDLLVGGDFSIAGGSYLQLDIVRWNGTAWSALGPGTSLPVNAIAVMPSGDIVVGGEFTNVGGSFLDHVARYANGQWFALGTGCSDIVRALTVLPNGDLVAGGDFTTAGGIAAARIARWNGTTWSAMGTGMNATVRALAVQGTTLFAGGDFSVAGGSASHGIASWNGTTWLSILGNLVNTTHVHAIATSATDIFLGGQYVGGSSTGSAVARFDGSAWNSIDHTSDPTATAHALAILPNGNVVAGGGFAGINSVPADHLAIGYLPSPSLPAPQWAAPGVLSGYVGDVAARPDGTLVVAGSFFAPGIAGPTSLATFDGVNWTSLQAGITGSANRVLALPGGDIAVATATNGVFRWNGASIVPLAPLPGLFVNALAIANGELIVGGQDSNLSSCVRRWTGAAWTAIGPLVPPGASVDALTTMPNGDIVAASQHAALVPSVSVWRWNGSTWSQVGPNIPAVGGLRTVAALPNGDLVVGGDFPTMRWNGLSWSPLGASAPIGVHDLLGLPDGDLLAVGNFLAAGGAAHRIARWDGAVWNPVGPGADDIVRAATMTPQGDVALVGAFTHVGTAPSPCMAQLASSCPAVATPFGTPCLGANGPMQLRVDALPWVGGALRATAAGFASSSLGLRVLGWQPSGLPLAQLHGAGTLGCNLLVQPDDVALLLPSAGEATFATAIPNTPTLVGTTLFAQVLQVSLGPQLQILALLGSDARLLRIGIF